jgi:hypothetical protein
MLRNLLGIKKKYTEEELENKSPVTLLREGLEEEGYIVTVKMNNVELTRKKKTV